MSTGTGESAGRPEESGRGRLRACATLLLASCCWAQQTEQPKAKVTDYPAHARVDTLSLGAEFMVHTFSGSGKTFLLPDYFVVEVAVYPAKDSRPMVAHSHFTLRVNGKRTILPQPPQFAAASLKYPDWEYKPSLEAGAGVGNTGVIVGRQPRTERFPGDPTPGRQRLPSPPRVEAENRSGIEKEEVSPAEVCVEQALPEGEAAGPIRGFLYFPFKGKLSSVKELELLYSADGRKATLALR